MSLEHLFEQNRQWAKAMQDEEADFFKKLVDVQTPQYLWIGCSDSRVPANEILGLKPGEVFVHRNVANLVNHTDFNCLSVLQYAVEVLKVEHVMVVGHYGCGGVRASMQNMEMGLIDNWLRHVRSIYFRNFDQFKNLPQEAKEDLLCELNAMNQARHVEETSIVQNAWKRGQKLEIHAWVYRLSTGLLHNLDYKSRQLFSDLLVDPPQ